MDAVIAFVTNPPPLMLLVLLVFATTELAKRVHRRFFRRYGKAEVWLVSFVSGICWAPFVWPETSSIAWFVPGFFTGPVVSAAHRAALSSGWVKEHYPAIHATITGDRRGEIAPPPDGIERRDSP